MPKSSFSQNFLYSFQSIQSQIVHTANRQHFATPPMESPENKRRNSILMTRHYPDLGSASDWSSRVENLLQPIRGTTSAQIWLATRHQYEISALVFQASFRGETSAGVAIACVANVSVRFRSKERGKRVKDRAKNGASKRTIFCS